MADPQPTTPEPHTADDDQEANNGRSATDPAEGSERIGGTPRDPSVPDD